MTTQVETEQLSQQELLQKIDALNRERLLLMDALRKEQANHCKTEKDYAEITDELYSPVVHFLELAHQLIGRFPFLYVEIARTRPTDWMAWVCTHNRDTHPDRTVLVSEHGSTPDEACIKGLEALHEVIGKACKAAACPDEV